MYTYEYIYIYICKYFIYLIFSSFSYNQLSINYNFVLNNCSNYDFLLCILYYYIKTLQKQKLFKEYY